MCNSSGIQNGRYKWGNGGFGHGPQGHEEIWVGKLETGADQICRGVWHCVPRGKIKKAY